jgi:hypothetical protein
LEVQTRRAGAGNAGANADKVKPPADGRWPHVEWGTKSGREARSGESGSVANIEDAGSD